MEVKIMQKKIEVIQAKIDNSELLLTVKEALDLTNFTAVGQVLVDSANFAFIYIVEVMNDYTYIVLPMNIWTDLKIALDNALTVKIVSGQTELVLEQIHEEMKYLIENIKGNSNYGEEMVKLIERTFNT